MFRGSSRKRKFGFTLVEVLVTTVVVGVMAAVVIPAMVKQTTAGDSPRVASDLGSVKSAIEVFAQNVRPRLPGDLEDLVNLISETDKGVDGTVYTAANVLKWKGPYLEYPSTATATDANTVVFFNSGGNAAVSSALYRCPAAATNDSYAGAAITADLPCTIYTGNQADDVTDSYVSIRVTGIPVASTEFATLNDIIDGTSETDDADSGILRQNASGTVFFLAVPFTAP